eukprot:359188-Chlamydomonas_euryale.AAC.8
MHALCQLKGRLGMSALQIHASLYMLGHGCKLFHAITGISLRGAVHVCMMHACMTPTHRAHACMTQCKEIPVNL